MIALDCNILVQLALPNHPSNSRTVALVRAEAERGQRLVVPALVVTEFMHVITDPRRFAPAITSEEALDWMEKFLGNGVVQILEPSRESLSQTLRWLRQFKLGRKRILDTHLAAILYTNDIRRLMTSNPDDFAVFGVLELLTP